MRRKQISGGWKGGKQMASLDNIQVQKQGICATCEHVLHAQYVLYPASQKTHLNGCMNSINSRIFEKKKT